MGAFAIALPLVSGVMGAFSAYNQAKVGAIQTRMQGMSQYMSYQQQALQNEQEAAIAERNAAEAKRAGARAEADAAEEASRAKGRQVASLLESGTYYGGTGSALMAQSDREAKEAMADARYDYDLKAESLLWQRDQAKLSAQNARSTGDWALSSANSMAAAAGKAWKGQAFQSLLGGVAGAYGAGHQLGLFTTTTKTAGVNAAGQAFNYTGYSDWL